MSALKFVLDVGAWTLLTPVAFWLRLEGGVVEFVPEILATMGSGVVLKSVAVLLLGLPSRSWHRFGFRDTVVVAEAVALVSVLYFGVATLWDGPLVLPRSVPLIEGMLALLALGSSRVAARHLYEGYGHYRMRQEGQSKPVLVVGAGEAGGLVTRELLRHPEAGARPVGFLDDDPTKQRRHVEGVPVVGRVDEMEEAVRATGAEEVVIAMPSAPGKVIRRVVELAQRAGVGHRTIPGVLELLRGEASIAQLRPVNVEDLLRREPVHLKVCDIRGYVEGRTVLVTGAGGSIGSELVRQVARFDPARIVLLGRGENGIYHVERECRATWPALDVVPVIADLRDAERLEHVFARFRPSVVFHAAAHKHVPLMEANPDEAVLNNVGGTRNLVGLALRYEVERFVNVSTDKAVNPTSIMGATKRVSEYLVEAGARRAAFGRHFVSVRFGNVLGSRGSVIPLFEEQIRRGGPVTLTHPDMVRYFMTIPEATQLVLQAGGMGGNGNVYVLDMGEPVRILDLAEDLIRLSGLEPGEDIEVTCSGLRPGEKLFEELLTAEEGTTASQHEKIFVARKRGLNPVLLDALIEDLMEAARTGDPRCIRAALAAIIPTHSLPLEQAASGEGARRAPNEEELAEEDALLAA